MNAASFIKELQNSDNNRKLRWLIGLTVATVAIIAGLWMLFASGGSPTNGSLVRKEDQPTFFGKIAISTGHIVQTLREKTANTINYFSHKFGTTNDVEVQVNTQTQQTTSSPNPIKIRPIQ